MSYSELKGKVEPRPYGGAGSDVTRDQHLLWCMERALALVDRGEVREGFTSMLSDLTKHPELEHHKGGELGVMFMMLEGWIDNEREVRRWIEGFN